MKAFLTRGKKKTTRSKKPKEYQIRKINWV